MGDHGYHLGEQATWSKKTNFELGLRIPLIIRAPWRPDVAGQETDVLAEAVDLYPTLAELAGLPPPREVAGSEGINGTSLAELFWGDQAGNATLTRALKSAAFSQFAKNNLGTDPDPHFYRDETALMGYTIRTDEWRYTAWFRFADGRVHVDPENVVGTELYDHRGDTCKSFDWPGEDRNLAVGTGPHPYIVVQGEKLDEPPPEVLWGTNITTRTATVQELHKELLRYIRI